MDAELEKKRVAAGQRTGTVCIPASKSRAHRLLIMAALSGGPVELRCPGISNDIQATMDCLRGLGYAVTQLGDDTIVVCRECRDGADAANGQDAATDRILPCRDSGSTLRFMMPLAGALGTDVVFQMEGRLPERPLAPFDDELRAHGMSIRREGSRLYCSGKLESGRYTLPGNVSSQYISGLLMSLPMLSGDSELIITGEVESRDYINMTLDALRTAGIAVESDEDTYRIGGGQSFNMPQKIMVEGDWSSAAFFLSLGALSEKGVTVKGVDRDSLQGDKAILDVLKGFGAHVSFNIDSITVSHAPLSGQDIDASGIPDLVPVISVVAAAADGTTTITGAARLRLKESDRLKTTTAMLKALGADITELEDSLIITGCGYKPADKDRGSLLSGGCVDSARDHRIAMSAAVAASICRGDVFVTGPECVKKSYASFWEDFEGMALSR